LRKCVRKSVKRMILFIRRRVYKIKFLIKKIFKKFNLSKRQRKVILKKVKKILRKYKKIIKRAVRKIIRAG